MLELESLPKKAIILLEEPEIALHAYAEYNLGKYLMDLAIRRGHQILLTTHSNKILESLPAASLIFLHRNSEGISVLPNLGARQATSLLTDGHDKSLVVLVEDDAASLVLAEIIRTYDDSFLRTIRIAVGRKQSKTGSPEVSGKDAVIQTMKILSESGLQIAAVLDGNEIADAGNFIFKLPGNYPPEEELIRNHDVKAQIYSKYKLDQERIEAELRDADCHDYFSILSQKTMVEKNFLIQEAAQTYAGTVDSQSVANLIELLKEAASRK